MEFLFPGSWTYTRYEYGGRPTCGCWKATFNWIHCFLAMTQYCIRFLSTSGPFKCLMTTIIISHWQPSHNHLLDANAPHWKLPFRKKKYKITFCWQALSFTLIRPFRQCSSVCQISGWDQLMLAIFPWALNRSHQNWHPNGPNIRNIKLELVQD